MGITFPRKDSLLFNAASLYHLKPPCFRNSAESLSPHPQLLMECLNCHPVPTKPKRKKGSHSQIRRGKTLTARGFKTLPKWKRSHPWRNSPLHLHSLILFQQRGLFHQKTDPETIQEYCRWRFCQRHLLGRGLSSHSDCWGLVLY